MVTSKLLYHIHKRLNELSSPVQNAPFGGKSVLVCENIYQLPSFPEKSVFMIKKRNTSEKCKFSLVKLTEMRQRDDLVFKERISTIVLIVLVNVVNDSIDDT